jgi:Protein of unknown function (DUF2911)
MRQRTWTVLIVVGALLALAIRSDAQRVTSKSMGKGGSPHETVEWTVDGATITITYGRPFLKGREIGKAVAPYGEVWRTGADAATTLVTTKPLMFGSLMVPAGTYTLYTLPAASGWQLIINKQTGQWGTEYSQANDLGRVPLTEGKADKPAENFTISIDDTPSGGTLRLEWGTIRQSTTFMVH